tara:strand:- start:62 stop:235 length:174 start_codon:yes stop_codon:yes gene_type:complete
MIKRKNETIEDILDRIQEDIDSIREKCVCNGEETYASEDDDSSFDEDEDWVSDSDED